MDSVSTNTSYTTKHLRPSVLNQLITKEYNVIINVSIESSNKELDGTLLNQFDMHISCGNEQC